MDWKLLLFMAPFMIFAWWAGFVATKRMRLEKNRLREEAARKQREARQQAEQEAES